MAEKKPDPSFLLVDDPTASSEDPSESQPESMPFGAFALSLSASALLHLGVLPENQLEGEPPPEINLDLARQTIEILEMLRIKTQGNLDAEEERLLEDLLHDLRMRFIEVKRRLG